MQLSIHHKAYECLRWRQGARDCVFDQATQELLAAAVRPVDAQYLVELAAAKGLPLEQLLEQHPKLLLEADYVKRRAKDAESPEARQARLMAREEGREERLKQQEARRVAREEALSAALKKTVALFDLHEDKAREWRNIQQDYEAEQQQQKQQQQKQKQQLQQQQKQQQEQQRQQRQQEAAAAKVSALTKETKETALTAAAAVAAAAAEVAAVAAAAKEAALTAVPAVVMDWAPRAYTPTHRKAFTELEDEGILRRHTPHATHHTPHTTRHTPRATCHAPAPCPQL